MSLVVQDATTRRMNALKWMAIARGVGDIDGGVGVVYLQAVLDVDPAVLEAACKAIGSEPRGQHDPALPSVGDILERCREVARQDADRAARARVLPAHRPDDREPTFHCLLCYDEPNAWRLFWCPGKGHERTHDKPSRATGTSTYPCSRHKEHGGHTYAERCECSDTNPVIFAHRERMAAARPKKQIGRGRDS